MIIFYSRPNTLSLPYIVTRQIELRDGQNQLVYDKDGNVKKVNKDYSEYFRFIPGSNSISAELWLKIVECNKKNMEHYSSVLKIFKPKIDKKTDEVIGEDENNINERTLDASEIKDLINNTMNINDINKYFKYERERDKVRPSVMKAIKLRKAQITKADEAFSKKDDE